MSPQVGFACPKSGRNEIFDFCFKECQNKCLPLPLLLSLSKQSRESESNIYHVTEILTPPQIVYLKRNFPYYITPNSLIDSHVGSAWHAKIEETKGFVKELGLENEYLMEKNFKKHFKEFNKRIIELQNPPSEDVITSVYRNEVITLSGTSDLYVKSTKALWDYKVMKYYYTFKYLSEGKWNDNTIPWQLNIYRVYQYPDAKEIKILCYIKDWKMNFPERYCVDQIEELQVPMIPDHLVREKVVSLLTEHVTTQKTCKPRPCTEDEMWNRKVRCTNYCNVRDICKQFSTWKEDESKN